MAHINSTQSKKLCEFSGEILFLIPKLFYLLRAAQCYKRYTEHSQDITIHKDSFFLLLNVIEWKWENITRWLQYVVTSKDISE